MKIQVYKAKDTVALTLTKQEAWDLAMVCHGASVLYQQAINNCTKNSMKWNHYRVMLDKSKHFENIIRSERLTSEIEEIEI